MSRRRRASKMSGYKPSGLRIISGPISPASPLSPLPSHLHFPHLPSARSSPSALTFGSIDTEVPPEALPWLWSCHKCHTRYPLGATRRCLNDGHLFCGGTSVDKVTGKLKRHRACGSEFDYIGWEDFGSWKKKVVQQRPTDRLHKDCEHQCDFPSACHWKTQHAPQKNADFGFLDPKCLGTESNAPPAPEKSTLKKTGGVFIDKLVKAAEKRTVQLTTLLYTIEEEKNLESMPGYIRSPVETPVRSPQVAPPKLPQLPSIMNGLDLRFPMMDFSSLKDYHDDDNNPAKDVDSNSVPPENSPPELTSSVSSSDDEDADMTDWLSEDITLSTAPPRPPNSAPQPEFFSFNFGINSNHGPQTSTEATSAEHNVWGFTAGDIGIALGSPTKPKYSAKWDEAMDMGEGMESEHMLWTRDLHRMGGRLSV